MLLKSDLTEHITAFGANGLYRKIGLFWGGHNKNKMSYHFLFKIPVNMSLFFALGGA